MSECCHRANSLAFLCGLHAVVIVSGFLLGSGFAHWSHRPAIPFEPATTTGPEWGHVIFRRSRSPVKHLTKLSMTLSVASEARDQSKCSGRRYRDMLQGMTRAPEISHFAQRRIATSEALCIDTAFQEKTNLRFGRRGQSFAARPKRKNLHRSTGGAGQPFAPSVRAFDVPILLGLQWRRVSCRNTRASGPTQVNTAGMSAEQYRVVDAGQVLRELTLQASEKICRTS